MLTGENVLELGNGDSQYPMRGMVWCQDVRPECHNLLIEDNIQCGIVPRSSVCTGGRRKSTALK